MELVDVIQKRRSVRSFQMWKEVPDLSELISLAKKGPSAGGIRGFEVIVTKERIAPYGAPIYIVICTNPEAYVSRYGDRGRDLYSIQDATIIGSYLQLLLVNIGLSSCWIGAFNEDKIKKTIGIELRPVVILAVGYMS